MAMIRIPVTHRVPPKRRARLEEPARLELTLELPRDPERSSLPPREAEDAERGAAVIDFFI